MSESRWLLPRYYAYRATNSAGFYLPVSIVYLQQSGFGLAFIGLTQATFAFAMLLAEVPSGYLGDRIGRRGSLAVGSALRAGAMLAYPFLDAKAAFLFVQVVWASGFAFRSGTQDAWLYELLRARCSASEYARIEGRGSTILLAVSAGGALVSGLLYAVTPGLPFFVNAALALSGLGLLATFPAVSDVDASAACSVETTAHLDPTAEDNSEVRVVTDDPVDETDADPADADEVFGLRDAIRSLRLQVERPSVRWLVVYAALFSGLFSITRWLEQPMLTEVGVPITGLGVLYAGFKLVSAGAAATTGWLEEHLGPARVFLLVLPVYGLAYASVALVPLAVVPVLFVNRTVATVLRPIRNQYLNDRLDDVGRATVLSGVSMVLSLAGGVANVVGGEIAGRIGGLQLLPWAGVAVVVAGAVVWVATSPIRPDSDGGDAPVGSAAEVAGSD